MVAGSLKRTLVSKDGYQESKVPVNYKLSTGHVYFFYNKGKYLHKRYDELIREMMNRGFSPSEDRTFPVSIFSDNNLYNDWTPTMEDYKIIRQRIAERIAMKPEWYRKTRHTRLGYTLSCFVCI